MEARNLKIKDNRASFQIIISVEELEIGVKKIELDRAKSESKQEKIQEMSVQEIVSK